VNLETTWLGLTAWTLMVTALGYLVGYVVGRAYKRGDPQHMHYERGFIAGREIERGVVKRLQARLDAQPSRGDNAGEGRGC
jgi:hypothetical protein